MIYFIHTGKDRHQARLCAIVWDPYPLGHYDIMILYRSLRRDFVLFSNHDKDTQLVEQIYLVKAN